MSTDSHDLISRVRTFITDRCKVAIGGVLYVGLSGGPDSVALLHMMQRLGFECQALHCNFHLRGAESDRDEAFCRDLCKQLGISLEVRQFDTRSYMAEHHMSLEMAARQLRYAWWAERPAGTLLAVGHHQDDSIETMLMNLLRGTGIDGLTGIVPRNEASAIIRPLLCLSRADVLRYLDEHHLPFITDSSNLEADNLRNRLRLEAIPLLEQIVPQAQKGILTTMEHLAQSAELAQAYVAELRKRLARHCCIDGFHYEVIEYSQITRSHPSGSSSIIFALTQYYTKRGYDMNESTTRHLVAIKPGQSIPSTPKVLSEINEIEPDNEPEICFNHSTKTQTLQTFNNRIAAKEEEEDLAKQIYFREHFDAEKITFPIVWRRWHEGDRINPLGMNDHTKLLSDLFSDAHLLPIEKHLLWVCTDASNRILWVPGIRMCNWARITPSTQKILNLSIYI